MDPRLAFFLGSFFLTVGFSFSKGGAPERCAAAVFFFGLFATIYMQGPIAARFMGFDFGLFLVDSAMLTLLIFLALFAERFWTIWMAGFQIIQTLSHLPRLLLHHVLPDAYETIVTIWAYPMLVILACATLRHRQRVLAHGSDKSWSNFSPAR